MNQKMKKQSTCSEIFEAFPAPRGWQFGGDVWAGDAHQKDTSDFLPARPSLPIIRPIEISIIRNASVR